MANEQYLERIGRILVRHRRWLLRDPSGRRADLSFHSLKGLGLSRLDLTMAHLTGCDLKGALLKGTNLSRADLYCSDLSQTDMTGARVVSADLRGARVENSKLVKVDMRGADLRKGRMMAFSSNRAAGNGDGSTTLTGSDLSGALMTSVRLVQCDLAGCNLTGADLTDGDLSGAVLIGANLTNANLNRSTLEGIIWCGARMDDELRHNLERRGVDLDGVGDGSGQGRLAEAIALHQLWVDHMGRSGVRLDRERLDLRGYNLSNLLLSGCRLHACALRGADLSGARLAMADLSNCDLRDADLTSADLSGCNLRGANLQGAKLWRAKMRPVDLAGDGTRPWPTNLTDSKLDGADLRDVVMASSLAAGASLVGIRTNLGTILPVDVTAGSRVGELTPA